MISVRAPNSAPFVRTRGSTGAAGTRVLGSSVIVVPGLGFDARRNRLGRGGRHYDRFIASARAIAAVLVVGVAYELQVVPEIPVEPHDQTVDRVATEMRVLAR